METHDHTVDLNWKKLNVKRVRINDFKKKLHNVGGILVYKVVSICSMSQNRQKPT